MVNVMFMLQFKKNVTTDSRKRHELVRNLTLHHDNAWPHVATSVQKYLIKCIVKIMSHPLCSPDLTPCNICLFPTMKEKLRGRVISVVQGHL